VTSQDGEDGIIERIFSRVSPASRLCVEFGAWDGKHLSNVWNLWANEGWSAVLIEADPAKHRELAAATADNPKVATLCGYVTAEGEGRLDRLLAGAAPPGPIDLLSIDIDGNEYDVWRSVTDRPVRVVIVEHNPTIPPHIEFVSHGANYVGSSARALVTLGKTLGYELVACTMTNCIFVQAELYPALGIESNELSELFDYRLLTWVMSSYSGELFLSRPPTYLDPRRVPAVLRRSRPLVLAQVLELGRRVWRSRLGSSFGRSAERLKGPFPELLFVVSDE
jgi:hypothetical protein